MLRQPATCSGTLPGVLHRAATSIWGAIPLAGGYFPMVKTDFNFDTPFESSDLMNFEIGF